MIIEAQKGSYWAICSSENQYQTSTRPPGFQISSCVKPEKSHPCWRLESCATPRKKAHDVMDRLEIVANPSKKERMTSWTGWKFLQNTVSSLSPGFRVRILRPSEKEKLTISTHHTTNTKLPIMYNHDPIYTQCNDQFNNTCTTLFLQTSYEWQMAVGSTILAAHTAKTSICQLLVRPTGGGKTLVSTATESCIKCYRAYDI